MGKLSKFPKWYRGKQIKKIKKKVKRTASRLDLHNSFKCKHIGAAPPKNQGEHGPDGQPLRDGLDEHAASESHRATEYGAVIVDAVHLGLLQRRARVYDPGGRRRLRRRLLCRRGATTTTTSTASAGSPVPLAAASASAAGGTDRVAAAGASAAVSSCTSVIAVVVVLLLRFVLLRRLATAGGCHGRPL